jgi:hypothetical protein
MNPVKIKNHLLRQCRNSSTGFLRLTGLLFLGGTMEESREARIAIMLSDLRIQLASGNPIDLKMLADLCDMRAK